MEGSLTVGEELKISELAAEAGVPVATVRHYLREGLLPEGKKTSRNMAYYPRELVERIQLIKRLQEERFMPLKVIGELLQGDGDGAELGEPVDVADRVLELATADERERITLEQLSDRSGVPAEVVRRLADLGVLGSGGEGFTASDVRIAEAIARFRAGGYDESVGFTVHDAANFVAPLEDLARREIDMLSEKLVGRFEPERALEMFEAGVEPLRSLIDAMHSKLLVRELQRRRTGSAEGGEDDNGRPDAR